MIPANVATLANQILTATPEQQQLIWNNQARSGAVTSDPFRLHRGGADRLIETRRDLAKGGGTEVRFPITNEYMGTPVLGDVPMVEGDFESDELKSESVKIGLVKFGQSSSDFNKQSIPQEILGGTAGKLGRLMGRLGYEDAAMTHLHTAHPTSRLVKFGNSPDDLRSADEFAYADILEMAGVLGPMGGEPITMNEDANGSVLKGFHFLTATPAWTALKADATVQNLNINAAGRGNKNPVFTGELYTMDGNLIQHWAPVDHGFAGPVGSPYAPKAFLGQAITAATTDATIYGGRNLANSTKTKAQYFRWFPHLTGDTNKYKFASGATLAHDADIWGYGTTGKFYVTIVNPRSGAGGDGKWCIYEVDANTGNTLVTSKRLAASISGTAHTTVGGVTWDSAKHTTAHPEGALVYLSNNKGLPLCVTPGFGRRALRCGMGMWDNFRHQDPKFQGMYNFLFIYSVFGHACVKDFGGQTPGILNMIHTYKMEGWNIPTVS
jgi:hypothetical protein